MSSQPSYTTEDMFNPEIHQEFGRRASQYIHALKLMNMKTEQANARGCYLAFEEICTENMMKRQIKEKNTSTEAEKVKKILEAKLLAQKMDTCFSAGKVQQNTHNVSHPMASGTEMLPASAIVEDGIEDKRMVVEMIFSVIKMRNISEVNVMLVGLALINAAYPCTPEMVARFIWHFFRSFASCYRDIHLLNVVVLPCLNSLEVLLFPRSSVVTHNGSSVTHMVVRGLFEIFLKDCLKRHKIKHFATYPEDEDLLLTGKIPLQLMVEAWKGLKKSKPAIEYIIHKRQKETRQAMWLKRRLQLAKNNPEGNFENIMNSPELEPLDLSLKKEELVKNEDEIDFITLT